MVEILRHIDLRDYNSFGVSAVADAFVRAGSVEALRELFSQGGADLKWNVLGGGNNILFIGDYHGLLIKPEMGGIAITGEGAESVSVRAGAGVDWDGFVSWAVERGLWGVENLSAIPGTVGASPVQNIGAYGVEAKDVIESVEMYLPESDSVETLAGERCGFGYRDSVFKNSLKGRVIITAVNFRLGKLPAPNLGYGDLAREVDLLGGPSLLNVRGAVINIRDGKLPDPKVTGNAGSFFKNPVVDDEVAEALRRSWPGAPVYPVGGGRSKLAAGWLIEQAGWKGRRMGRVGVHPRQSLVLVNLGGAAGQEVLDLAGAIQGDVLAKFGVEIEMEVNVFR